jgi:hypothetical protein
MTSVQAGEVEAVHEVTTENVYRQQLVPVEGQTDILTMGLPYICPYNVNSIMNPILVMCLGLGYFFNMYRGKPLVREGGVLIMSHPTPWEFHPVHHPSYIDFFEQVLAETTDPVEIEAKYEKQFAEDEWYRHLYRTSYAYHGVHPFYMWYWGSHGLQHLGKVIIVGGDPAVRRLGFTPASTFDDALEMASDVVGRSATITHLHNPPLVAHHLPRGRAHARRVGSAVPRRRGVPVHPLQRARGARAPRRHGRTVRQGHEAPEDRHHEGHLRRPDLPGGRRRRPSPEHEDRGGRGRARRRDARRLVGGTSACAPWREPQPQRTRRQRLAPHVGADGPARSRQAGRASAPEAPLARPRLSTATPVRPSGSAVSAWR